MFSYNLNEWRRNTIDYIMNLPDYREFNKAQILDIGLQHITENIKQSKDEDYIKYDLFMDENKFREFMVKNDDSKLEEQMKMITGVFNELTKR